LRSPPQTSPPPNGRRTGRASRVDGCP
jgi:hypothetical protein